MRAWRVTIAGIDAVYRAHSRSRATYLAARAAWEAGFGRVGELLKTARCRRAPESDVRAVCGDEVLSATGRG